MEIRNRLTGEVISQQQYLDENPGVQLPRTWTQETFNAIGYDPVYAVAPDELPSSSTKEWVRDGVKEVTQDGQTYFVYNWVEQDIYVDIPDGETKAQQEAAHLAREEKSLAEGARNMRNDRLRLSDWVVLKAQEDGVSMPEEWKAYRQALRDIPSQDGFPRNVIWPNMPS